LVSVGQVTICDYIFVAVVDGAALTLEQVSLLKEPRDAIHLNDVLNVLLSGESLKREFELFVLFFAALEAVGATTARLETTAQHHDVREEDGAGVAGGQFATPLDDLLECFRGLSRLVGLLCVPGLAPLFSFTIK